MVNRESPEFIINNRNDTNFLQYPLESLDELDGNFVSFKIFQRNKFDWKKAKKFSNNFTMNEKNKSKKSTDYSEFLTTTPGKFIGQMFLYFPAELSTSYSLNYEDEETGILGAAINNSNKNLVSEITGRLTGKGLSQLEGALGSRGIVGKTSGFIRNPYMEVIFKSPEFRTHEFNYIFKPRSEKESEAIKDIVYKFKYHAHPDIESTNSRSIFSYPDEFEIGFINSTNRKWLFRIGRSYLTNVSVNYSGEGVASFFKNGAPTSITLSLTFKETEVLTKKEIDRGY